jgi:uncharacterized membrane protein
VGGAELSNRFVLGAGPVPPEVAAHAVAPGWLVVLAAASGGALVVGSVLVVRALRTRRPRLHRTCGRIYVAACVVGGTSGLVLAVGASSGPVATAGFGLLAVLWLAATILAWRSAVGRRFAAHRA